MRHRLDAVGIHFGKDLGILEHRSELLLNGCDLVFTQGKPGKARHLFDVFPFNGRHPVHLL